MSGERKSAGLGWGGWVGLILSALSVIPWILDMLGVDTSGILVPFAPYVLAAMRPLAPIGVFVGGMLLGWWLRRMSAEDERLAAETSAHIAREDREHEEQMRRDREEYEAEKARKEAEEKARSETQERKSRIRRAFVNGDYGEKLVVKMTYGYSSMDVGESFKRFANGSFFKFETIGDGRYRCDVSDMMREVIEETPEIIDFCTIPDDAEDAEWLLDEINGYGEKRWQGY